MTGGERYADSNDGVLANLPDALHPVFRAVAMRIRATSYASRTEVFLQWCHDNGADVARIQRAHVERLVKRWERDARRATQDAGYPGDATDRAFYARWLAQPAFGDVEREIPGCRTAYARRAADFLDPANGG